MRQRVVLRVWFSWNDLREELLNFFEGELVVEAEHGRDGERFVGDIRSRELLGTRAKEQFYGVSGGIVFVDFVVLIDLEDDVGQVIKLRDSLDLLCSLIT